MSTPGRDGATDAPHETTPVHTTTSGATTPDDTAEVATPDPPPGGQGGGLGHTDQLHCEVSIGTLGG